MGPSAQYAAAHVPDNWRVLGQRLDPISIGHGLLLARLGSPFAPFAAEADGRGFLLGDVLLAVWVLGQPWTRAAQRLQGRCSRWFLAAWEWQLARKRHAVAITQEAGERLAAAIGHGCRGPRIWEKASDGASGPAGGAPQLAVLKVRLMSDLRRTEAEALGTPIGVALWDLMVWSEGQGRVQIYSDTDLQISALLNEPKAEGAN